MGGQFLLEDSCSLGIHERPFLCFSVHQFFSSVWAWKKLQSNKSCDLLATGGQRREIAVYAFFERARGKSIAGMMGVGEMISE